MLLVCLWQIKVEGPWQNLGKYVIWVALGSVIISWGGLLTQWQARKEQVMSLAGTKIVTSSVSGFAQITLGWLSAGGALINGDIVGRSAGLVIQFAGIWKKSFPDLQAVTRKDLREALVRYRAHSLWLTPTAFFDAVGQQAPLLLMLTWYGDAVGGQFSLVQRLLAMPVALIGQSIAQLFFPAMVQAQRNSSNSAKNLFFGLSALLSVVALCLVSVSSMINESWLVSLLGTQWSGVGKFVIPLSIVCAAQLLGSTLSQTAIVLGAQKWFSFWVFSWVSVSIGGMWIGHRTGLVEGAIWGLTVGSGGAYLVLWTGLMLLVIKNGVKVTATEKIN